MRELGVESTWALSLGILTAGALQHFRMNPNTYITAAAGRAAEQEGKGGGAGAVGSEIVHSSRE